MKSRTHIADPVRNAALAAIHVAKKQLGLDDELYREVLRQVTRGRIESSADATPAELAAILDHLRKRGFVKKAPAGTVKPLRQAQVRMARGLWIEGAKDGFIRNREERAFCGFIKGLTGVDRPQWLNASQTNKVIEALKDMRRRWLMKGGDDKHGADG